MVTDVTHIIKYSQPLPLISQASLCLCACQCDLSISKPLLLLYIWDVMADLFSRSVFEREVCLRMLYSKSTYWMPTIFKALLDARGIQRSLAPRAVAGFKWINKIMFMWKQLYKLWGKCKYFYKRPPSQYIFCYCLFGTKVKSFQLCTFIYPGHVEWQ